MPNIKTKINVHNGEVIRNTTSNTVIANKKKTAQ